MLALTWSLFRIEFDRLVVIIATSLVGLVIGPLAALVVAIAVGHMGGSSRSNPTRQEPRTAGSGHGTVLAGLLFGLPIGLSLFVASVYGEVDVIVFGAIDDKRLVGLGHGLLATSLVGLLFGLAVGGSRRLAPRSIILRRPTRQDVHRGRRIILAGGLPIGLLVGVVVGLTVGSEFLNTYYVYRGIETTGLPGWEIEGAPPAEPNWVFVWNGLGVTILVVGYGVALLAGLLFWLVGDVWNLPLAAAPDVTPRSVYRKDAQARLVSALLYALVAGLVAGFTFVLIAVGRSYPFIMEPHWVLYYGLLGSLFIGPAFGLVGAFRDSAAPILLCTELACLLRRRPVRFLPLLEDARDRQILRQAGAVYQFRHADLQDRLANQYQLSRNERARNSTP